MNATNKPRVKICCISSAEEAHTAIRFGASALGLVGHMPGGPGVIHDALIAEIAAQVTPPVSTFLLSSETTAPGIIAHYKNVNTSTIQLHHKQASAVFHRFRNKIVIQHQVNNQ